MTSSQIAFCVAFFIVLFVIFVCFCRIFWCRKVVFFEWTLFKDELLSIAYWGKIYVGVRGKIMIYYSPDDLMNDNLHFTIKIVIFWLMIFLKGSTLMMLFLVHFQRYIFFQFPGATQPWLMFLFFRGQPLKGLLRDFENEFSISDSQALVSL